MSIYTFFRTLALSAAVALVAFVIYGNDLLFLAKGLALALAFSMVLTIALPILRGIRKGDRVSIVGGSAVPLLPWMFKTGTALTNGTLHKEIRIRLEDGKEAFGIVESYDSFFPPLPPRVRVIYEERPMDQ